jgi:hypothetical protein
MLHDNSVHYLVYHVGVKLGLSKDCTSLRKCAEDNYHSMHSKWLKISNSSCTKQLSQSSV